MDKMTKREIERRLKVKGLSNRESKIMVSVLSDTLRDMMEEQPQHNNQELYQERLGKDFKALP